MKNTLLAVAAALLMATGTGCQTLGPCGGGVCNPCGDVCGCGDACGSICGDACCGGGGSSGGLLGEIAGGGIGAGGMGLGGGIHPGAAAGGLAARLQAPSAGAPRISGNFNWRQRHETKHAMMAAEPGSQSAAYTYPYYTTRGPRDFFMDNPPPLGR